MVLGFIRCHLKLISEMVTGIALWESFNFLFDFFFFPFALLYWGDILGGIILYLVATMINASVFAAYEYMHIDWLGANALRELDDEDNKNALQKLMTWFGREKTVWWEKLISPVVFVMLALPIDPVILAVHYRRQHFHGLTWRDWGVFLAANTAAIGWWLLKIGIIVEAAKWIWLHLIAPFLPMLL